MDDTNILTEFITNTKRIMLSKVVRCMVSMRMLDFPGATLVGLVTPINGIINVLI